jgi:hypothetical protein
MNMFEMIGADLERKMRRFGTGSKLRLSAERV